MDRRKLAWIIIAVAAVILTWQLFIPPIVGLADQGDFARILGTFGYAAEDGSATIAFVAPKYVSDYSSGRPGWEQPSSEYVFVACAILLNKIVSRDGKLDIVVIGIIHALAFLAAALGDAWDNVKHLFLFNLTLDAGLIFVAASVISGKSQGSPASNAAPSRDD
jgi:hypothetical protein